VETFLLYLSIAVLFFSASFGIELAFGNRSIPFLKDASPSKKLPLPRVSIIIPARNEEKDIQKALRSILAQDYEKFQIIVVNDRSTDQTGAILAQMAQADSRLQIVHVEELPHGWLGKNYALSCGVQQAIGEFFLFTDADVVMEQSTVSRAIRYMVDQQLDHIAIAPEVRMPGILLEMFAGAFGIFLSLYTRPWKAKNPKSGRYVGIGAFNLVRADAYRAVGTHQAIAMRPDDDLKLGKLIKLKGYRQEPLFGKQMLYVEWYSSLRELIDGLMKNAFAGADYRISKVVAASIALFTFNVWPFLGMFLTHGVTQIINFIIVGLIFFLCFDTAQFHGVKRWCGIGFPIATLLFIYIMWRAMMTTIFNNGIKWRGTHYSLAELKANRVENWKQKRKVDGGGTYTIG
jgi:glycosyltransferase involved in cell wall biosynthesis